MSHIVSITTQLRDPTAIATACTRLGLAPPVHGTAQMYAGTAEGLLVQLPGWTFPIAIDVASGEIKHDHYEGNWGDPVHLDRFLQAYACEKVRLEARARGHMVTEQQLADGSIKLQVQEGA